MSEYMSVWVFVRLQLFDIACACCRVQLALLPRPPKYESQWVFAYVPLRVVCTFGFSISDFVVFMIFVGVYSGMANM